MAVNVCEERILKMQEEYPFLRDIGYSLKNAYSYLSDLNIQLRKEKEKNKQKEKTKEKRKKREKFTKRVKNKKKKIFDSEKREGLDQTLMAELKLKKQVLVNYLRYLKRYHKIEYQVQIEEQEDNHSLTEKQQLLLAEAMDNQLDHFRLCDLYTIYCYALEQEEYYPALTYIVKELQKRYLEMGLEEKEEVVDYFGRLRQQTNACLLKLEKKSELLRKLSKVLQNDRDMHNLVTMPIEQVHDPLEDYLKMLLNSSESYEYLEKILYHKFAHRDVVNFKDSEGNHILFYVQDLLFHSCKMELINQSNDYIKKEYYQKIWQLFIHHPQFSLTEEERISLHDKEMAFVESIQKCHYKNGPIIQQFIYNLWSKEVKEETACPLEFTPCYYGHYRDLKDEYTFALAENKQCLLDKAYSVQMTEQGTFLVKIHIVDVSATILEDTELDNYLKDKMFNDGSFIPESIGVPYIYLQQDTKEERPFLKETLDSKKRPVITYEVEVNGKGKILTSDVYPSMIVVNQVISYDEVNLQEFKKDDQLYPVCYLYYAAYNDKQGNIGQKIEKAMLSLVKKVVGDYITKSNLPMIYCVQDKRDDELYMQYMKEGCYIFGKMDIEEAQLFHSLLREDINYAHFGLENIGHFEEQDTCCIRLFHPCSNYIDIVIQRLIKMYFYNKDQSIDTDRIEKMLTDIALQGNEELQRIRSECKIRKMNP